MYLLSMLFAVCFSVVAVARSPFSSTVRGISIDNTHLIETKGTAKILRGSAPNGKFSELVEFGVTRVLVFKNELKNEVRDEVTALTDAGLRSKDIHQIAFKWKDLPDGETVCRQVVEGLRILEGAAQNGEKLFFHCTVGEDRTGLLAGLFRMHYHGWKMRKAFDEEMCRWGYAEGDEQKPKKVVRQIQSELTPVFAQFAVWIEAGDLTDLNPRICRGVEFSPSSLRCPRKTK